MLEYRFSHDETGPPLFVGALFLSPVCALPTPAPKRDEAAVFTM